MSTENLSATKSSRLSKGATPGNRATSRTPSGISALSQADRIHHPGWVENFFVELAGILQVVPPDLAKFGELAARFGHMDVGLERFPELKVKYNLKLVGE